MKYVIKGYLVYNTESGAEPENIVSFQACKPWGGQAAFLVGPYEFEVELPGNFDSRPAQIKALEAQQKKASADFEMLCTQIKRQISELEAIEYTLSPEAV